MDIGLQELITRGRHIFAGAPRRLELFDLVNGRRNTADLAQMTKRHANSIRRDLTLMADAGLILPVTHEGEPVKKDGFPVFEKLPLARTLPLRHFQPVSPRPSSPRAAQVRTTARAGLRQTRVPLSIPSEEQLLSIARSGEDQIYEFKAQGADVRKITREICAMLNTEQGGIVFYGVDDDGSIEGTDISRQDMDQRLQNSVKTSISPAATIRIATIRVLGSDVIAVVVPPWNRRSVYQFDEKILIRKGTNVFGAKPEEVKQLHEGKPVV